MAVDYPVLKIDLGALGPRLEARLEGFAAEGYGRRLWAKDPTLWSREPVGEITDRLGWLDLPGHLPGRTPDLSAFAAQVRSEGVQHVLLLGMGGSSLAPEVFARTFGPGRAGAALTVLDSTHPEAVLRTARGLDLERTLFVVSSKSGTTLETLSLFRYFWALAGDRGADCGRRFVAVTDPGTPLQALAEQRGFRRVFSADPDVGGRYSALTDFGLVPAALAGVDLDALASSAASAARACSAEVPERDNPGLRLGAALGEAALAGRDKVTFLASPALAAIPVWMEQLIAESTGKEGRGIVPVADEPRLEPAAYGSDRLFVSFSVRGEPDPEGERLLRALEASAHPVIRVVLDGVDDLGGVFFLWEVAVASAGSVLGIHPFNQPDVQLAKELAKRAMSGSAAASYGGAESYTPDDGPALAAAATDWCAGARPGDYACIQAYLAPDAGTWGALEALRGDLGRRLGTATTAGYGPRFLHSTGQLHKGGPNTGLFLQLVDDPADEAPVPETDFTFKDLIRAQALGDQLALLQRGRRVFRVDLGRDWLAGLQALRRSLVA